MSNKNYSPLFKTFNWLRAKGTIDTKAERALKLITKKYPHILVIGNPESGKSTVANTLLAYMQEQGQEPIYTPTICTKTPHQFKQSPVWKPVKNCLNTKTPVIVPARYEAEYYGDAYLPGLLKTATDFDAVVDVRRLPDDRRQVCQIYVRKGGDYRCIYRAKTMADLQIGMAA